MKTSASLLLFVLLVPFYSHAQHLPFPAENAVWDVVVSDLGGEYEGQENHKIYRYSVMGDTLINDLKYSKIYLQSGYSYAYISSPFLPPILSSNVSAPFFYAALRTDELGVAKIIRYWNHDTTEVELYRFNSMVGDQMAGFEIGSIKTISLFEGDTRRRYFLGFESIIEGIGSTIDPLDDPFYIALSAEKRLLCYKENGVVLYVHERSSPGAYLHPCNLFDKTIVGINPTHKHDLLEFFHSDDALLLKNNSSISRLVITDLKGTTAYFENPSLSNEITIPKNQLPRGLVLMHVYSPESVVITKKIVLD